MDRDNYGSKKHPPGCVGTLSRCILFALIIIVAAVVVWAFFLRGHDHEYERRQARMTAEKSRFKSLSMALEEYRTKHSAFPPDSGVGLHPDLDKPSECLVYYLSGASIYYDSGFSPPDYPWDHEIFNVARRLGKGREDLVVYPVSYEFTSEDLRDDDNDRIPELVDPWGNPYLYNAGGAQNGPFNQNGAPKHNKTTYDISSAGPDGEHGTDDDITNWQD